MFPLYRLQTFFFSPKKRRFFCRRSRKKQQKNYQKSSVTDTCLVIGTFFSLIRHNLRQLNIKASKQRTNTQSEKKSPSLSTNVECQLNIECWMERRFGNQKRKNQFFSVSISDVYIPFFFVDFFFSCVFVLEVNIERKKVWTWNERPTVRMEKDPKSEWNELLKLIFFCFFCRFIVRFMCRSS